MEEVVIIKKKGIYNILNFYLKSNFFLVNVLIEMRVCITVARYLLKTVPVVGYIITFVL